MEDIKTTIGSCRSCEYRGPVFKLPEDAPPGAIQELLGKYFHCEHEDSPCEAVPLHFGCNLWEKIKT